LTVDFMKPFRASSPSTISGSRELGVLLLGFVLAVACFMGLTLYADTRLATIAERSHEVSDNAMPSVVVLGALRRDLAAVQYDLHEAARGDYERIHALDGHVIASEQAWRQYLDLPIFPGEPELQEYARARMDTVRRVADQVRASVEAGALLDADTWVKRELEPATREADEALARLIQLNHDRGRDAAIEADRTWSRARRLSIVADIVCALLTGALAWLGFRATRRFMSMQKRRADELEAFASRVAHDVRGPLTPALFTLQMFEREFANDERRRPMAERGTRSLRRVDQLVGDLLQFARAAAAPDRDAQASLVSVVSGVVQDLEPQAAAARVRVEVAETPPCAVACSPGVLASIVMNLVSNAIKYMPLDAAQRMVSVRSRVDGAYVRIEVSDTGAGLPEAVHGRIFEPYVRVDQRQPGLGLGLATVRRLVDAHRGQVGVKSREGTGALFWVALPLARSVAVDESAIAKASRLPAGS
jgi:signal transduction histidine kinase